MERKYLNPKEAAYICLKEHGVCQLPVNVMEITRAYGIKVVKNSAVGVLGDNQSGTTLNYGGVWYIVYDDTGTVKSSRFTVAHEFGHIILGHSIKNINQAKYHFFDIKPDDEAEADKFAEMLLCPACVLWGMNIHSAFYIETFCKIPRKVANVIEEKLNNIYRNNSALRTELARDVFENFKDFIQNNKDVE